MPIKGMFTAGACVLFERPVALDNMTPRHLLDRSDAIFDITGNAASFEFEVDRNHRLVVRPSWIFERVAFAEAWGGFECAHAASPRFDENGIPSSRASSGPNSNASSSVSVMNRGNSAGIGVDLSERP